MFFSTSNCNDLQHRSPLWFRDVQCLIWKVQYVIICNQMSSKSNSLQHTEGLVATGVATNVLLEALLEYATPPWKMTKILTYWRLHPTPYTTSTDKTSFVQHFWNLEKKNISSLKLGISSLRIFHWKFVTNYIFFFLKYEFSTKYFQSFLLKLMILEPFLRAFLKLCYRAPCYRVGYRVVKNE